MHFLNKNKLLFSDHERWTRVTINLGKIGLMIKNKGKDVFFLSMHSHLQNRFTLLWKIIALIIIALCKYASSCQYFILIKHFPHKLQINWVINGRNFFSGNLNWLQENKKREIFHTTKYLKLSLWKCKVCYREKNTFLDQKGKK